MTQDLFDVVEQRITLHEAQLLAAALAGLPDRLAAAARADSCAELGLPSAAAATRGWASTQRTAANR